MKLTTIPKVDLQLVNVTDLLALADENNLQIFEFADIQQKQGWSFVIIDNKIIGCNYRLS